ncbi:MAG: TolC family protein, partial [Rhodospirillaceae bacterium]
EQARNAWDNLQTFQARASQLHNQANIAAEFLELARRERQLGNRSLIDVLSGETALINASSDAAAADTDVAIAVFTLLSVLGRLDPSIVN